MKIDYLLIPNTRDKLLTYSKYVRGSNIVVDKKSELQALISEIPGLQIGTLCYVIEEDKTYRYRELEDGSLEWVEEKLGGGADYLEDLTLKNELKVYTNVGKITGASPTNGIVVGNEGESFTTVWDNMFGQKDTPGSVISKPSLSVNVSPTGSREYGTSITSFNLSLSRTDGIYSWDKNGKANSSDTGVIWNSNLDIEVEIPGGIKYNLLSSNNVIIKISDTLYTVDLTKTSLGDKGYETGVTGQIKIKVTQSYQDATEFAYSLLGKKSDEKIYGKEKVVNKTFSLSGEQYIYKGMTSTEDLPIDENNKITLEEKTNLTSCAGTYSFTPANQFLWIAIPSNLTINKIVWNNNELDEGSDYRDLGTQTIILDTNISASYRFYQFVSAKAGSFKYIVS